MGVEFSRANQLQRMAAEKSLEEMCEAISKAVVECAKLEGPLSGRGDTRFKKDLKVSSLMVVVNSTQESAVTTAVTEVTKLCARRAEGSGQELKKIIRRERLTQAIRGTVGGGRMGGGGLDPLQKLHADLMVLHLLGALTDDDSSSSSGGSSGATGGASRGRKVVEFPVTRNEMIGKGSFGAVYAAEDKNGLKIALKQVPREAVDEKALENELKILGQLSHNNIIKIYGSTMDKENVFVLMELVEGSIKDKMKKSEKPIPQGMAKKYTRGLLQGLVYLHGKDVIHRDIRCSNVLLDSSNTAKLADMGISKSQAQRTMLNFASEEKTATICWMSPETVTGNQSGKRSDVWSVGCTVYEMVKGKPPFAQEMPPMLFSMVLPKMIENMQHRELVRKQEELGPSLQNFLLRVFVKMDERPFAEGLLSHPWPK